MQLSSVFVLQIPAVEAPELSAISLEELLSDDEESAVLRLTSSPSLKMTIHQA
jgi:hypothetical protein